MATKLLKKVVRELDRPVSGRTLMVALEPGNIISMREKGRRLNYIGSLERVYMVLARWHADKEIEERNKQKKLKKMGLA
jgi:hypothetical protein